MACSLRPSYLMPPHRHIHSLLIITLAWHTPSPVVFQQISVCPFCPSIPGRSDSARIANPSYPLLVYLDYPSNPWPAASFVLRRCLREHTPFYPEVFTLSILLHTKTKSCNCQHAPRCLEIAVWGNQGAHVQDQEVPWPNVCPGHRRRCVSKTVHARFRRIRLGHCADSESVLFLGCQIELRFRL